MAEGVSLMADRMREGKVAVVTGAVVNDAGILRDRFFHKMSADVISWDPI
jgi:hypothetical protein